MSDAPWLDWMKSHIGEPEYTGSVPTPFIEECFSHTNYGPLDGSTPASCAATLCAALEESGYRSTRSAAALSYANYGEPSELKQGAIIVFQWASGDHHVSVCDTFDAETVACIGGNQGHLLQPSRFNQKWIIATRWPSQPL